MQKKKKKACNSYKGKNEIKEKQRTIDNIYVKTQDFSRSSSLE